MFFEPFVPMDTKLKKEYTKFDVHESLSAYSRKLVVESRVKKIKKILDIWKNSLSPMK